MARIMLQGTGSTVGKSVIVTALCRILKQDGYKVCPYKSQNMGLNSYITPLGKEMGRAQVLQAYAAGLKPDTYMNPIFLKPTTDRKSKVILNGEFYKITSAKEYHTLKPTLAAMLKEGFEKLEDKFDVIIMEGAGSPAEINLRDSDIVNMGMAELVDAPVLLVGDIDKGGVFASLAGTMLLLSDNERQRVKGTIINKFRGDIDLLTPGLDMLEDIIKKPSLGVVPYFNLNLEDEDGAIDYNTNIVGDIDIGILKLSNISNFTDFDPFLFEEDVGIRFITKSSEFRNPDILIIPASRNIKDDIEYLKSSGLDEKIQKYSKDGIVVGISTGYYMLGHKITLNTKEAICGLGIIDIETKVTSSYKTKNIESIDKSLNINNTIKGYIVETAKVSHLEEGRELLTIVKENNENIRYNEGYISNNKNIIGTSVHGLFENTKFREEFLNRVRSMKKLPNRKSNNYILDRETELDKLADIVRGSLDMNAIYKIISKSENKGS